MVCSADHKMGSRTTIQAGFISSDHPMTNAFPVTRAEVYWFLFDNPSATAQEIADRIDLAKSTVRIHLTALEKAGLLISEGRPKRYKICHEIPASYQKNLQELESLARSSWRLRGIEPL